ncbi:MAG: hypothetical protein M1492_09180 [Gammaproteobacteria bacterium]|nr:hypothetical protein [Gammaproteobacteria bacterium]
MRSDAMFLDRWAPDGAFSSDEMERLWDEACALPGDRFENWYRLKPPVGGQHRAAQKQKQPAQEFAR